MEVETTTETAEQKAARWNEMAEQNVGPVVAQLADLYKRLDKEAGRHRELAEQLGDTKRDVSRLEGERDAAQAANRKYEGALNDAGLELHELKADVKALREQLDIAIIQRDTLANECHATLADNAPGAMDFDAARLCRRYMGLPEEYATFLEKS